MSAIIAVAQMAIGSLLIHVTGGRIETHFHVFGSLAFLCVYRDARLLGLASAVVLLDHVVRGALAPASVYGVESASFARTLEHGAWVAFEDVFLVGACLRWRADAMTAARRIAELEAARRDAEALSTVSETNRLKSEFIANMSHEIRTPMAAIQGFADLLLDPSLDASNRLNYTQTIRRNSVHLLSILNDVLDLSKVEAGRMTVEQVACSPTRVVAEVASLMRVRALEKRLDFRVDFMTPIPETIATDPTRLRQILVNLVGNAVKFTSRGTVAVIVRCVDPDSPAPRLELEVSDTGIGLTREQIGRLFRPFSQGDASTTRKFGGTGLGLAICKRLAALMSGDIEVESLPGRGSSFTLSIPTGPLAGVAFVTQFSEACFDVPPAARSAAPAPIAGRVLLAEDGLDNQLLIATHLRRGGLEVAIVDNGRAAVDEAWRAEDDGAAYDVVLMDMQMPELDGYAATAKLRSRGYAGPIVALTAHAMVGDREQCLSAGCDEYLTKPIDRGRLLGTVAAFVGRARGELAPPVPRAPSRAPLRSSLESDPELAEALEMFRGRLEERASTLEEAHARGDLDSVRRLAHQLQGSGGSFGFPQITQAAASVHRTLGAHDVRQLASLCRRAASREVRP